MTLADNLKPVVYNLRSIAGKLGFRPYEVSIIVRESIDGYNIWDGVKNYTETEYNITHKDGYSPKVRFLTSRDYAVGYSPDAELEIGPITPDFTQDGYTYGLSYDVLNSVNENIGTSIYYKINGPGFNNSKFELVSYNGEQALGYMIQVKRISNDIKD